MARLGLQPTVSRLPNIPGAKKIVRIGGALLICGNCFEIVPRLAGRCDTIISDPPYGIGYDQSSPTGSKWKDVKRIFGTDAPFDPTPVLGHAKTMCRA